MAIQSNYYGSIMEPEASILDIVLRETKDTFGDIRFLEIGVLGGKTARGVCNMAKHIGSKVFCSGVDFISQKPNPLPCSDYKFYEGDSLDAWRIIKERFNIIIIDGCHCVNHVMCDFLNYTPMLDIGGRCIFHDTDPGPDGEAQGRWPQDHSYYGTKNPPIGVREAIRKLGLIDGRLSGWGKIHEIESDNNGTAGMIVFKRMF